MKRSPELLEQLAHDRVRAYEGDSDALNRLDAYYERSFAHTDHKAGKMGRVSGRRHCRCSAWPGLRIRFRRTPHRTASQAE